MRRKREECQESQEFEEKRLPLAVADEETDVYQAIFFSYFVKSLKFLFIVPLKREKAKVLVNAQLTSEQ